MSARILTVEKINITSKQKIIGFCFALITVFIWSIYFLSLRFGALTALSLEELALFRYAVPGILLLPIFIKSLNDYKKVPLMYLLGIIIGSGLAFFLLSAYGMQSTPVVYASTLIPGTTPLFVSIIAIYIFKQSLSNVRKYGLISICFGVIIMLLQAKNDFNMSLLQGQVLFLFCALLWALFTISIRQAGLPALKIAALAAVPNAILIILWIILSQPKFGYLELEVLEVVKQVLVQGILVGIISGMCFSAAISRIGAEKAAAIGGITPVIATLLASISLNEQLSNGLFFAMFLIIAGVFLASGVLNRN